MVEFEGTLDFPNIEDVKIGVEYGVDRFVKDITISLFEKNGETRIKIGVNYKGMWIDNDFPYDPKHKPTIELRNLALTKIGVDENKKPVYSLE
jgi:hypothetical protein